MSRVVTQGFKRELKLVAPQCMVKNVPTQEEQLNQLEKT